VGKAASVTAEGYETARQVFALGAESAKRRSGAKCARQRSDGRFPGRPDVAAGAREAGSRGLVVDVVLFARSLRAVIRLVDRCPNTRFVLAHLGKPQIRARRQELGE